MQDLFIYTWIRIWQACINEFIIVHSHNEVILQGTCIYMDSEHAQGELSEIQKILTKVI